MTMASLVESGLFPVDQAVGLQANPPVSLPAVTGDCGKKVAPVTRSVCGEQHAV